MAAKSKLVEAAKAESQAAAAVELLRARAASSAREKALKQQVELLMRQNEQLAHTIELLSALSDRPPQRPLAIQFAKPHGEATAVVVYSDWHVEERVNPAAVGGLNRFNLAIAEQRIKSVVQSTLRLIEAQRALVPVRHLVVALLGDFISGHIHDELVQNNELAPLPAITWVADRLESALLTLAKHSGCKLSIVCHDGNHGRTTRKPGVATRMANSYEYWMYQNLRKSLAKVGASWYISEGENSIVTVGRYRLRFQHGDAIRYGGGVGGISVPVYRALSKWDRDSRLRSDYDFFGHFHHFTSGGRRWFCNGSLIGYSPYAMHIQAEPEDPCQSLAFIDHKRGLTHAIPVFCD